MTTTDVFQRTVTAMSSFGDVPLGGEVDSIRVTRHSVAINLDSEAQPAQALLVWLGSLASSMYQCRRLSHFHANNKTFVSVEGRHAGENWDVYATFDGEDAAVLCDAEHDEMVGSLSVHRLRLVQMQQLARAVAA